MMVGLSRECQWAAARVHDGLAGNHLLAGDEENGGPGHAS
jgi:hypothetical protein